MILMQAQQSGRGPASMSNGFGRKSMAGASSKPLKHASVAQLRRKAGRSQGQSPSLIVRGPPPPLPPA